MTSVNKYKFENAELIKFSVTNSRLEMMLEDVLVNGDLAKACITVTPVRSILVDGEPLVGAPMVGQSGEVLEMDISDSEVSMIVVWVDYSRPGNEKYITKSYQILGDISCLRG